ncbi:MAG: penicillin-binding protein 2 [Lentisphaeria bacterium]|nr:penicillin-binding protein 2 [Lentisphaeria bacterium]
MTLFRSMAIRMALVYILLICGFGYVARTLYTVQIARHGELFEKAQNTYTTRIETHGTRGEIFDFDGSLLVGNLPTMDIIGDPANIFILNKKDEEKTETECRMIADFFEKHCGNINSDEVFRRLKRRSITSTDTNGEKKEQDCHYAVIATGIEYETAKMLKEKVKELSFHGISFTSSYRRKYPKNTMLANILGLTNVSYDTFVPIQGIERSFNDAMTATSGSMVYERARNGRHVTFANSRSEPTLDGYDIFLTIREPLQAIVEEELDLMCERVKPHAAWAVLVDPSTGDVLAAAQRPTFNPNDRTTMTPESSANRLSELALEPGSIMKPFVISYALDKGFVTPGSVVDCEQGVWKYAGRLLHDTHNVGKVPVTEVIKQSSNIGTAKVSVMMGAKNLDTALRSFGFGQKTGIQLKPETSGIFRPLEKWDSLSVSRFCIGQGIAVSPLQLARAYCMIANGGYKVNLRIVDRIERGDDVRVMPVIKERKSIFANPTTKKMITDMMIGVTEAGGTCTEAAIEGFHVAGKTGTAQKVINGQYSNRYYASFVGFVPAEDPKFVLLVTCDDPTVGSRYGGSASGPTFKAIAERTLKYMHVQPQLSREEWLAERSAAQKALHERKVREDALVQARREERDRQLKAEKTKETAKRSGATVASRPSSTSSAISTLVRR